MVLHNLAAQTCNQICIIANTLGKDSTFASKLLFVISLKVHSQELHNFLPSVPNFITLRQDVHENSQSYYIDHSKNEILGVNPHEYDMNRWITPV